MSKIFFSIFVLFTDTDKSRICDIQHWTNNPGEKKASCLTDTITEKKKEHKLFITIPIIEY